MRSKIRLLCGGAMLALLAAATFTSPAGATSGGFTGQLRSAGFSAAQAAELQSTIDHDPAARGGKQVAANRVEAADGSAITYTLPGEKYAHLLGDGLDGNDARTPFVLCSYGAFCGWPKANYEGSGRTWAACGKYFEIPDGWNSGGSWINNQTHHYTTSMYGKSHNHVFTTDPAYSSDSHGNWGPVWYVRNNC
ncbi:hypothetical protein ACFWY9_17405 [Amycolatopsis sp. NPDC059027]|uniref:hypothetical protein n=1 Tax=Amycolatopsis sp. NPDC059027 TaxID=3346709 RepID=UPI00366B1062